MIRGAIAQLKKVQKKQKAVTAKPVDDDVFERAWPLLTGFLVALYKCVLDFSVVLALGIV